MQELQSYHIINEEKEKRINKMIDVRRRCIVYIRIV